MRMGREHQPPEFIPWRAWARPRGAVNHHHPTDCSNRTRLKPQWGSSGSTPASERCCRQNACGCPYTKGNAWPRSRTLGLEPFLSQLLHGHSPVPRGADETTGFRSREAAAPAQVASRDMGEEVQGLPAARTRAEVQVMEEEKEEESSFLLVSSPATSSCSGNIFSDCWSRRDCSEGLCTNT